MDPIFFESAEQFRAWLAAHHDTETEVLVGFHKKATGTPTMTWSESVDQALCFGWIDGRRNSLGSNAYTIRFTPRKPTSNWSKINVAKVEDLTRRGLMHEAGLAAYARRDPAKTGVYSFENEDVGLGAEFEAEFRRDEAAWAWYAASAARLPADRSSLGAQRQAREHATFTVGDADRRLARGTGNQAAPPAWRVSADGALPGLLQSQRPTTDCRLQQSTEISFAAAGTTQSIDSTATNSSGAPGDLTPTKLSPRHALPRHHSVTSAGCLRHGAGGGARCSAREHSSASCPARR